MIPAAPGKPAARGFGWVGFQERVMAIAKCAIIDFSVTSMKIRTEDGREWSIELQASGGYRLFEIVPGAEPAEHDGVDGDWSSDSVIDYLAAVGAPRMIGGGR